MPRAAAPALAWHHADLIRPWSRHGRLGQARGRGWLHACSGTVWEGRLCRGAALSLGRGCSCSYP